MIRSGRPVRGSSPLARGLRPAQRPGRHRPVDHPRSRGVYQGAPVPGFPSAGSSPYVGNSSQADVFNDYYARRIASEMGSRDRR